MYVYLSEKAAVHRTSTLQPNCLLDYRENGTVVGIELLGVDLDDITARAAQVAEGRGGDAE